MWRKVISVLVVCMLVGCGSEGPVATPGSTPSPGASVEVEKAALVLPTPTPVGMSPASPVATPQPGAVAPTAAAPVAPAQFVTVTVQSGDTLLGLAMTYGVPMAAIQLQNDLGSSTVIQLGQALVIPPSSAWEGASAYWLVHEVSEGETLSEIAQAYGLGMDTVQGANGLADVDLLSIGQALVLPLTDLATSKPLVEESPTEAAVAEVPEATVAAGEEVVAATPAAATPAAAAEVTATEVPAAQVAASPPPADVAQWPYEVVRIMNEVRAANGLSPLVYNETLALAAQIQANDCAARGSCSHTGSDGSTIKDRILRVGYSPASWAECWAIRPTPQGAIDIWMNETPPNDPHRRTLLTTWLTEIGIGVAKTTWGYYFIADFGKPLQ